ncbi:MAG: beta-lactamase family protein [Flavobacteriales bacterium]|nr:beta-lactamase family protein [Flavobacteriales bacterium]
MNQSSASLFLTFFIALILYSCGQEVKHDSGSKETKEVNSKSVELDELFSFYHREGIFNGVVLAAENGKVIYRKAFGYANIATGDTLLLESKFRISSMTKQFTAMCIMILKEQGKLSYDEKLNKYLPELKYNDVTIRHLLWHTSGIGGYGDVMDDNWPANKYYSNKDVIKMMTKTPLDSYFKPGEEYAQSDAGYLILATIVERVAKVPFRKFVKQHIFDKIGMSNSEFPLGEDEFVEMKNRAYGFDIVDSDRGFTENDYNIYNAYGDGGMYSTIDDMFKWDRALYTEVLVKKETLKEAFEPYVLNDGTVGDYGFGWSVFEYAGNKLAEHSGSWLGFKSHITRDLTNKHFMIVLSNEGEMGGEFLHHAGYDILIENDYSAITNAFLPKLKSVKEVMNHISKRTIQEYQGRYVAITGGQVDTVFVLENKGLVSVYFLADDSPYYISPTDSINFVGFGGNRHFTFDFNSEGGVDGFDVNFIKEDSVVTYDLFEFDESVGFIGDLRNNYDLDGDEWLFEYEDGFIYVEIPNDGDYKMYPITDEIYGFFNWPAYSVKFTTDATGKRITGIEYFTPDGVDKLSMPD